MMTEKNMTYYLFIVSRLLFLAAFPWLLTGCMGGAFVADMSTAFHPPIEWKEEVLLQDGRTLIVDRKVSFGVGGKMSGGAPVKSYELDFKHPDTSEFVHWESDYNLMPMLLGCEKGHLYFVADPYNCSSWEKYGKADSWYVLYRYENGEWRLISREEYPSSMTEANLLISLRGAEDALKEKTYFDYGYISYLRVKNANSRQLAGRKHLLFERMQQNSDDCQNQINQRNTVREK